MLVIGNNNNSYPRHKLTEFSKMTQLSSKLGRTAWFTLLYFFLHYQHIHKRQRGYIMFPPASMGFSV